MTGRRPSPPISTMRPSRKAIPIFIGRDSSTPSGQSYPVYRRTLHLPEIDLARVNLALWERDPDGLLRLLESIPAPVFETQVAYLPKSVYAGWAHRLRGDDAAALAAFDSAQSAAGTSGPGKPQR